MNYPGGHSVHLACIDCHQADQAIICRQFSSCIADRITCHIGNYVSPKHESASVSALRDYHGVSHKPAGRHCVINTGWNKYVSPGVRRD